MLSQSAPSKDTVYRAKQLLKQASLCELKSFMK